jgi:hypothetical protein
VSWFDVDLPVRRCLFACRPSIRGEALRTDAPVNHLRFIDLVTRGGGGVQARSVANGAVDVGSSSARAADQVVVIVADTILVESRRPSRPNAPDDALLGQHPEGVVYRLSRDGADLGANIFGHVIRRTVGPTRDRTQHGDALGRNLETVLAKLFGWIAGHDCRVWQIMGSVKLWTESNLSGSRPAL